MIEDTAADVTNPKGCAGSSTAANAADNAHPPSFDLGNLLIFSPTPFPSSPTAEQIHQNAQQCAQKLIAELLTTCPIHSSPDKTLMMTLPPPATPLPREKPLPKPKEKTKWERFAEKKGIGKKDSRKETGGKVFDEATGEWVNKWGYKGKNKEGEGDWIVEVDERKESKGEELKSVSGEGRRERKEKVRRNERSARANERRARKGTSGS
ncbi:MAG: hypothetical protein Q9163_001116 [Psora crenata]